MVWPPVTHQDVQDEIGSIRGFHADYFRSGYYSIGTWTGLGTSPVSVPVSVAYVRPFFLLAKRTFDRLGVYVSTAATAGSGGLVQMALYQPGAGIPGALVVETATLSSETVGAKEWVINQTLDPGVWWLGLRSVVSGCSVPMINSSENNSPFVMTGTTPPSTLITLGGYQAAVTGTGFPTTGWTAMTPMHMGCLRAA